jgi:3-deoxy-D-manno-octulosonic-acid transferase
VTAIVRRSPLLTLYRAGTRLGGPLAALLLRRRARAGKEDPSRLHERFGAPQRPRPDGPLIWAHAASVGESVSALPLLQALLRERSDAHALVTTGTLTSARLMAARLPERAFHQYVPVDLAHAVDGFLSHWRPDLALWIESELWPNMILDTARRGVPMALVSARLSENSHRNWARAPAAARALLSCFRAIVPQDEAVAARLRALGAGPVSAPANLKFWAEPLPHDPAALQALLAQAPGRPVWLAASTHEGEEALAGAMHTGLIASTPGLLTVIAPRHPDRGGAIASQLRGQGLAVAQRSLGETVTAATDIYLADTLGEMGLLYRFAPVALMGKTLIGRGGQNPLEPARLGAAIVSGPHIGNFMPVFDRLLQAKGVEIVATPDQAQSAIGRLLADPRAARAMGQRALACAADPAPLEITLAALRPLLTAMPHHARA